MNEPGLLARVLLRATALATLLVGAVLLWRSSHRTEPVYGAQTYSAGAGRGDSIVLRDGTGVLLLPGGRLTVAKGYGVARREVALVGEAHFAVRRDAGRPFRVTAGAALIQDLGATFTVRALPGGPVAVMVSEGSVILSHATARPGQGLTLNRGDRGTLSLDGRARAEPARAPAASPP